MKHGEHDFEYTGGPSNPFDDFTNKYQYESTPLEEMSNPETSDFSDELKRREKDKLRDIPEIKERTRDGMIDEYTRNLKESEKLLRKAYESGNMLSMRSLIFNVFDLKNRLKIMEQYPDMPPGKLREAFRKSNIGSKVSSIIDIKPNRYETPGHNPLVGLVEKYLGINEKNKSTPEVIRRKKP